MLSCNLVIIPMNFGASSLYNALEQKKVLYIACALQLVGAWVRIGFVFWGQFWFVILGQLIIFASAPLSHNIIGMVANTWFPEKERATASAIMILANPFSIVVAFGIQGYYSGRGFFPSDATPENETLVRRGTDWIILCQTFLTTLFVIYFFLVYRDKPQYPPS